MTNQLAVEQITKVFTSPTQYFEVTISDADLVPDHYQSELIQMRESWVKQYFRVGDIANELVQMSVAKNMPVSAVRVYKAIGKFCGKATRTIRYYAENAIFFSPDTRDEYGFLPFAFFDLARNYGQMWREVLEYAALHPAMSYDELMMAVTSGIIAETGVHPIETDDLNRNNQQVSLSKYARKGTDSADIQPRIHRSVTPDAMTFIIELGVVIDRVYQALRSFEIPEEMSEQIAFHLNALRKCVADALRCAEALRQAGKSDKDMIK